MLNTFFLLAVIILELTHFRHLSTGFFFLLSWSFFTYQHREEIRQDFSSLGSSYWLGALGWTLLLVVEPIVFIVEQAVVPDILPDLENAVEPWRISSPSEADEQSFSQSSHPFNPKSNKGVMKYMSEFWMEFRNNKDMNMNMTLKESVYTLLHTNSANCALKESWSQKNWSFLLGLLWKSFSGLLTGSLVCWLKWNHNTLRTNNIPTSEIHN